MCTKTVSERERECVCVCVCEVVASTVTAACGEEEDKRSLPLRILVVVFLSHSVFYSFVNCRGFSHIWVSTLTSVSSLSLLIFCFLRINRLLGCGRAQVNESNPIKVVSERGLLKRYGRFVRRHVQAHRLQPLSVEVEDEGHARDLKIFGCRFSSRTRDRTRSMQ